MSYKAALFALFVLNIRQGESLMCKVCNSLTNKNCVDKVDTDVMLVDCTPKVLNDTLSWIEAHLKKVGIDFPDANAAFVCFTIVRERDNEKTVIRGCNLPKNDKFDYCQEVIQQEPQTGTLVSCDICSTDGCNMSSDLAPSALHIIVLLVLTAAVSLS